MKTDLTLLLFNSSQLIQIQNKPLFFRADELHSFLNVDGIEGHGFFVTCPPSVGSF